MLAETFLTIASATREVIRNWRSMLIEGFLCITLLASLYLFLTIKEASITQVALTLVLASSTPVLFFALQAVSIGSASGRNVSLLLNRSIKDLFKLILVSLPLIVLAVLAFYGLSKVQAHFGLNPETPQQNSIITSTASWRNVTFTTIRYLLFGAFLPLGLVQLWIATVHDGIGKTIRHMRTEIARAFGPQSVLIYMSGFVVFALVPYLLLFKTAPTQHAWLEITLFAARLALVFSFALVGWVVTVHALTALHKHHEDRI